jgi:hypothetical protein
LTDFISTPPVFDQWTCNTSEKNSQTMWITDLKQKGSRKLNTSRYFKFTGLLLIFGCHCAA